NRPPSAAATPVTSLPPVFQNKNYLIRRKVLKIFGGAFHVYDPTGQLIGYSKMKAFKFKEDVRLYTDESMQRELLTIQARSVIDWGASYDVWDAFANQKVGALRRRGWKSMFKDEWLILDAYDREIGKIQEDGALKATLRRFIEFAAVIFPQKYTVTVMNQPVAVFKQNFNPFVYKLNVDLTQDPNGHLDRRLAVAAALMMAAVEGKQG
ncbi:MAG TPA: hypothetical protein VEA69_14150, partial [Tepidisphaeraceae bacterium]|nr:hypothetical protein [Tepidisphaeraceae bacterium]